MNPVSRTIEAYARTYKSGWPTVLLNSLGTGAACGFIAKKAVESVEGGS